MGHNRKTTKGEYQVVDKTTEETHSSVGENASQEVVRSPGLLQAAEYSTTSKDVFHISDNSNIEVEGDVQEVADGM